MNHSADCQSVPEDMDADMDEVDRVIEEPNEIVYVNKKKQSTANQKVKPLKFLPD